MYPTNRYYVSIMQVLGTTSHTVTDKGGIDIFGSPKNPTIIEPACLSVITKGIIPEKMHSLKKALPTATLPKAALLFSLLLPTAKLLIEIPSCTASGTSP